MIIRFVCPFGHRLAAHPDVAGSKAQCPVCLAVLYVPSPQTHASGKVKKVWNAPQPIVDMEALVQSALGDDWGDVPADAFVPLDDPAPSEVLTAPSAPQAKSGDAAPRKGVVARTVGPNPAESGAYGSYPPPAASGGRLGPGSSTSTPGGGSLGGANTGGVANTGGGRGSGGSSGGAAGSAAPSGVGRTAAAAVPAGAVQTASPGDDSSRMAPLRWNDLPTGPAGGDAAPTSSIHAAGGSTLSLGKTAAYSAADSGEAAPVGGPPAASSPLHPPNYAAAGFSTPPARGDAPSGEAAASSVLPPLGTIGGPGSGSQPIPPGAAATAFAGAATSFPAISPSAPSPFAPSPFAAPSPAGGGAAADPAQAIGGSPAGPSPFAPSPFAPSPFAPSPFAAPPAGGDSPAPSAPAAGAPMVPLAPGAFSAPPSPVDAAGAAPFAFPAAAAETPSPPVDAPIIFSTAVEKKTLWQQAGPARLWKLTLLSLCLALYAAASALPTYGFLPAVWAMPAWAKFALSLAVLKLLYAVFMAAVPDWSTVWLAMVLLALLTVMYGVGWVLAAFTAPGAPMLFGLDAVREHLKFWCTFMGLSSLGLSLVCARFSHQWRRDFELERKAAREARQSRVAL